VEHSPHQHVGPHIVDETDVAVQLVGGAAIQLI
jgi:hypothetical protein